MTKTEFDTLERDRDEWKYRAEDYAAKLQQKEKELADEKAKNTDMLGAHLGLCAFLGTRGVAGGVVPRVAQVEAPVAKRA